jgi:hypothetical protein
MGQRFRAHLMTHQIRVMDTLEAPTRTAFNNSIQDIFGRQVAQQAGRDLKQEKLLRNTIQQAEFKEAYVRLITVRNLPHSLLNWAEF